jgi:hypothetical protein
MARKTQQISVTVDTRVLADVRRRLRSEKKTLSEYVSDALADEVRRHHLGHALDAFEREHGAINSLELTEARAKLRRKPSRRRAA